ncbi:hypothetical protein KIL84_011790 [Mauremys mutica]|uniref:Hydroxyacid-oxoacid transhydrogenase, mitochondrial n=1 Tax=Mauremys mutica TaxID=74926 RepID=A0A9D3XEW9_9SAUR|nr:hypothetical protein KIL84_011790 [Mauremys mutica]
MEPTLSCGGQMQQEKPTERGGERVQQITCSPARPLALPCMLCAAELLPLAFPAGPAGALPSPSSRRDGRRTGESRSLAKAAAARSIFLFRLIRCQCPAHSHTYSQAPEHAALRRTDYAFEMAVSNIRYGEGVTKEVGMDLQNLGARKVCVMTDKNLCQLPPVKAVLNSLTKNRITFQMYDDVRVEPTDQSFIDAITFAKKGEFDAYVAVGGGSVIDTCKAANLYSSSPESDFLDYVNAPIGKGKSVTVPLKPFIAVPTTAGTGSETTGIAIFDYKELKVKTATDKSQQIKAFSLE